MLPVKWGKMVAVNVNITCSTPASAWTNLLENLPAIATPKENGLTISPSNGTNYGLVNLFQTGTTLKIMAGVASGNYRVYFTYICK